MQPKRFDNRSAAGSLNNQAEIPLGESDHLPVAGGRIPGEPRHRWNYQDRIAELQKHFQCGSTIVTNRRESKQASTAPQDQPLAHSSSPLPTASNRNSRLYVRLILQRLLLPVGEVQLLPS